MLVARKEVSREEKDRFRLVMSSEHSLSTTAQQQQRNSTQMPKVSHSPPTGLQQTLLSPGVLGGRETAANVGPVLKGMIAGIAMSKIHTLWPSEINLGRQRLTSSC